MAPFIALSPVSLATDASLGSMVAFVLSLPPKALLRISKTFVLRSCTHIPWRQHIPAENPTAAVDLSKEEGSSRSRKRLLLSERKTRVVGR